MASSSRATLRPEIEVSAIAARHSLVTSSITLRMRKRRPFESWSWTKSTGPAGVRPRLDQDRRPHTRRPLAAIALADGQALLAVKPLRLLSIQNVAFGAQKNVQPAITEPALLGSQLPQAAAQGVVSRSTRSVADGRSASIRRHARRSLISQADTR